MWEIQILSSRKKKEGNKKANADTKWNEQIRNAVALEMVKGAGKGTIMFEREIIKE